MTNRLVRSIVLVLTLGTGSVSAQSTVDSRLAARLDPRTRSAVAAIIDSARLASLPVEPLVDKALEGAAKRATSQQIVSAVRTFAGQLLEARRVLGDRSTDPELLGGAQAIRAGIPVQELERLRKARPGVQIATALTVASDLVAREVPVDTAVVVVTKLVRSSASDEQLLAVRSDIEADIQNGKPPALAASTRGHALEQTLAQSTLPGGAGNPGALPSPSGTSRGAGDGAVPKPPSAVSGNRSPASAPTKPPVVQRKRP
jgi:hypothetical protein